MEAAGRHLEAEPLHLEAWASGKEFFGPNHHFTIEEMHEVARVWYASGRETKAPKLMAEVVEVRTKMHGATHTNAALSRKILASWQRAVEG